MGSDPLVMAYAQGLFQMARAEGLLDRAEEELTRLQKAIETHASLKEFLSAPDISPEGKKSALSEIFGQSLSPLLLHWVETVVDQGRQRKLPAMIEAFCRLAEEAREKVTAEVITSIPLPEDLARRFEEELSRVTRKRVFVKPFVDESILGGVIVKLGDKVIDGSLRHRLEEVKQEMMRS